MNRRNLITAAAALSVPAPGETGKNAIFELRYYRLRNSTQIQRTSDFLAKYYLPAAQRAGFGPLGFFNHLVADQGPFVLVVTSYPSISAIEAGTEKMKADKEFQKGFNDYNSGTELSYIRMESSLLRAFDSIPNIEVPPGDAKRAPRIFELRTYESSNVRASKTKIKMFDDAEIKIFRRCGMIPVFFGETLIGRNLLDPARAKLHGHSYKQPLNAVLTFQIRGARQDLFLVLEDRLDHLDRCRRWSVVGAAGLQILYNLGAAVARAIDQTIDRCLIQK